MEGIAFCTSRWLGSDAVLGPLTDPERRGWRSDIVDGEMREREGEQGRERAYKARGVTMTTKQRAAQTVTDLRLPQ